MGQLKSQSAIPSLIFINDKPRPHQEYLDKIQIEFSLNLCPDIST